VLSFRATARRLGYDLSLEISGTVDAPQLQLSSSPPLSAENLMLMVTTGKGPTEDRGSASSSQRLAAVGAYMGRDMLRTLGVGGVDDERFSISSGEKVSRQGRETYGFEFKLDDRWSLTGEYDEFDAYNAGIKRRFGAPIPTINAVRPVEKEVPDAR
jgi:translocation and assembly module TamB